MRNILIKLLPLIFLAGCARSIIKLGPVSEKMQYSMFGKVPSRVFYLPVPVSDSVRQLWETDIHGGFTNSSVTAYGEYIFINDLSGWITCINIANGKVQGQLKANGAAYSSPVIDDLKVIFPVIENNEEYSTLNYYNFMNGISLNEIKIKGKVESELIKTGDGLIFSTENGSVFKYDLAGNKIWETDTRVKTHSSPALNGSIVVFGNDKGEILGLDSKEGKILYREKIGTLFSGSPSVSGDTVFIGNDSGILYALNYENGKVIWKFYTGSKIVSVPVFNSEKLYTGNLSGEIYSLNKINGSLNWKINLHGVLNSTPMLTENLLIVPDLTGNVFFINVKQGKIDKTLHVENRSRLSPLIIDGKLIIGSGNSTVAAYEFVY